MQQTQQVPSSTNTDFLRITNAAGNGIKHLGAEISSDNSLGTVTVSVKSVDLVNEFCTNTNDNSPDYANRCFEISAEHRHPAMLKLWTPNIDLPTGIRLYARLFQYSNNTGWEEKASTQMGQGNFLGVEGNIDSFSHFLIAQRSVPPTGNPSNQLLATTLAPNVDGSMSLSWNHTGSATYQIWRSQQPYSGYGLLQDNWQSTSFIDTTTSQQTNYFYEVRSVNPAYTATRVGIFHFPIQSDLP